MVLGERYFKLSNAIFCYGLKPIELSVYSYLVCRTGQNERCWPATKTIAKGCGCSANSVRKATSELEQLGLIRKVPTYCEDSTGRTRQTNNTYYLLELPPFSKGAPQVVYREGSDDGGEVNQQDTEQ